MPFGGPVTVGIGRFEPICTVALLGIWLRTCGGAGGLGGSEAYSQLFPIDTLPSSLIKQISMSVSSTGTRTVGCSRVGVSAILMDSLGFKVSKIVDNLFERWMKPLGGILVHISCR